MVSGSCPLPPPLHFPFPVLQATLAQPLPLGTVLDGEVVYNLHFRRRVFMVFDILAVGRAPGAGEGGEGICDVVTHEKFR